MVVETAVEGEEEEHRTMGLSRRKEDMAAVANAPLLATTATPARIFLLGRSSSSSALLR